jgi:hypothetical protein
MVAVDDALNRSFVAKRAVAHQVVRHSAPGHVDGPADVLPRNLVSLKLE